MGACCSNHETQTPYDYMPPSFRNIPKHHKKQIKTLVFTDSEDEDHNHPQLDMALPDDTYSVILDLGSFNTRLGLSGWHHPISILTLHDTQEQLFSQIFKQHLNVDPTQYSLLMTETLHPHSKKSKQESLELLFEKFSVPQLQFLNQGVLALFAEGILTGVSLDSGYQGTQVLPVFDGARMGPCGKYLPIAGKRIEEYLLGLKCYRIQEMVTKYCYVSQDYEQEVEKVEGVPLELPDKQQLIFKEQRIECGELLFKSGLVRTIEESMGLCDSEFQRMNGKNLVLSGGNTVMRGFRERIGKEGFGVQGVQRAEVKSWIGGEVVQGMSSFKGCWMERHEYEEMGSRIAGIKLV